LPQIRREPQNPQGRLGLWRRGVGECSVGTASDHLRPSAESAPIPSSRSARGRCIESNSAAQIRFSSNSPSELPGHRQKRQLVVGLAQTTNQRPNHVPKHLVGEVLVHEQQVLESVALDRSSLPSRAPARRPNAAPHQATPSPEHVACIQDRERFFPIPGTILLVRTALQNEIQLVAHISLAENHRPRRVQLLGRHVRNQIESVLRQPRKHLNLGQCSNRKRSITRPSLPIVRLGHQI